VAKRVSTRCVLPITPTTGFFIAEALDTFHDSRPFLSGAPSYFDFG
jgi:hypothetical protein